MARIGRKTQKILGGNSSENGQFGSARADTFVADNDPDVIQALAAWEQGLNAATVSGAKLPTIEEIQGIYYVVTRQIAYLMQEGVAEWNADTEYHENSIVKEPSSVRLYKSLTNENLNNLLSDATNWQLLIDLEQTGAVRVSSDDTTSDFLSNKLVAGDGISLDITDPASDEGLVLALQAGLVHPPKSLRPAITNGTDTEHDYNIAAGVLGSDDGTALLSVPALTKQFDAVFAAGTGAGGLASGSLANNTTYYMFAVKRTDGSLPDDVYADTSATAANIPTGWSKPGYLRRFRTDGSANIINDRQTGNRFRLAVATKPYDTGAPTTANNSVSMTVPSGTGIIAIGSAFITNGSVANFLVSPFSIASVVPSNDAFTVRAPGTGGQDGTEIEVPTDTNGAIRTRSDTGTVARVTVFCVGFIDTRIP